MLQQKALPEEQGIMDQTVMMRVKHYIAAKHPGFTAEQREAVLSNALHRMIDVHLPEFEEGTRIKLRQRLLARLEHGESTSLLPRDVLEVCLLLELEEPALAQLEVWMGKHQLSAASSTPTASLYPVLAKKRTFLQEGLPQKASAHPAPFPAFRRCRQLAGAAGLVLLLWAAGVPAKPALPPEDGPGVSLFSPASDSMSMSVVSDSPLPLVYTYHPIDTLQLKDWLQTKNSLLAEDPYFSAILDAAEKNNLNPLLLFAITGQEQGYVSKEKKHAKQIANNPFNVHHSWQAYNTGIADSAHIASKTILSISRTRPEGAHPIQWLNTRYAEDPEWWVGVNSIFEKLRREIPVKH
jgi:putative ABC transport system permease protein